MPTRLAVPLFVLAFCLAAPGGAWSAASDRDRDGLPDRWEKLHRLPTHAGSAKGDPDHDRVDNLREYRAHTNPRRPDSDGDGLSDYAEVKRHRTNPRRADTDGDGFSDRAEVDAGTSPHSRLDRPGAGAGGRPPLDILELPGPSELPLPQPSSPSPTPSPSPGPTPGACPVPTRNVAGGPDPFGGCWPNAANTGIPTGTVLSNYTGPCTITVENTVIDRQTVNCTLAIKAGGVRITNTKINGSVWIDEPSPDYSFTITDSEIDAGTHQGAVNDGVTAIGKSNFVATRVETHGGIRGVWCEYDCSVKDSWIHGQARDSSGKAHESAVRMGDGSIIRHNTLVCDAPDVPPDAGCSANLTGYGDFAPIRNNLIERNLFLATTGGTCAYGGSSGIGSKPFAGQAANIVFRDNVFQRRSSVQNSGKCGYWFAISDFDRNRPGNQWINNTWDEGTALPPG
jgi:hypothetical protein